jgi:hypothetical protein
MSYGDLLLNDPSAEDPTFAVPKAADGVDTNTDDNARQCCAAGQSSWVRLLSSSELD